MRKLIAVLMLSFINLSIMGQEVKYPVKGQQVIKIKDWKQKILFFKKGFWLDFKDTVVQQIGAVEFEKVRQFSMVDNIPHELTLFKGFKRSAKAEKEVLYLKLDKLVTYKIADLTFVQEEKKLPYVLLRAPYNENRSWDTTAKWDNVYFVFPAAFVELQK